ncbi:MAG: metalloregulator ArsR/SmtB family transcription factor [Lachnospiraceae bacterium]|nr:metalloregulator ArsR/SmtB family transcription factor [Lachnospiraceae bacterium]
MDNKEVQKTIEIMKALGHPTRIRIVTTLIMQGSCNVTALMDKLDLKQSNTSQHLHNLRQAGIVKIERKGNENYYEIERGLKEYVYVVLENCLGKCC